MKGESWGQDLEWNSVVSKVKWNKFFKCLQFFLNNLNVEKKGQRAGSMDFKQEIHQNHSLEGWKVGDVFGFFFTLSHISCGTHCHRMWGTTKRCSMSWGKSSQWFTLQILGEQSREQLGCALRAWKDAVPSCLSGWYNSITLRCKSLSSGSGLRFSVSFPFGAGRGRSSLWTVLSCQGYSGFGW